MTQDKWADEYQERLGAREHPWQSDRAVLISIIREAVAEERAQCATVAREHGGGGFVHDEVAAAIEGE